jgi:glucosamine 6-phosphate synthetase-like amidotransferase/phosphosugar isomerase protein
VKENFSSIKKVYLCTLKIKKREKIMKILTKLFLVGVIMFCFIACNSVDSQAKKAAQEMYELRLMSDKLKEMSPQDSSYKEFKEEYLDKQAETMNKWDRISDKMSKSTLKTFKKEFKKEFKKLVGEK